MQAEVPITEDLSEWLCSWVSTTSGYLVGLLSQQVDEGEERIVASYCTCVFDCCRQLSDEIHINPFPTQAGDVEQLNQVLQFLF
jgi:hypothetical protein